MVSRRQARSHGGNSSPLIRALSRSSAYPHAVRDLSVIETHISWVVLTGDYAYKIKKPVRLPFLDFSSLAKREHFCQEEIRLNRRLSPALYLDVVSIGGRPESPVLGGEPAIEYAVKMRQFPGDQQLDHLVEHGAVSAGDFTALAELIAGFHADAAVGGPDSRYGTPGAVHEVVRENLEELRGLSPDLEDRLVPLAGWSEERFRALGAALAERKRSGFIREGHGDLHLSNLVMLESGIAPFDCLEFNPNMRWLDVIDDIAFLIMDLQVRGRNDLAHAFLSRYLAHTGDYAGLRLLRYYLVHRSLVRAKVAAIRARQEDEDDEEGAAARERARRDRHLDLALATTSPQVPAIILMRGLSGSGKSWLSSRLVPRLPALRIRSDLERKRLAGLSPTASSDSAPGEGLYTSDITQRTYERLEALAAECLAAGLEVIVDAAFLRRGQLQRFSQLAERLAVPFIILDCRADPAVLEQRVATRAGSRTEVSEAGLEVLRYQRDRIEPLDAAERARAIEVDTGGSLSVDAVTASVAARLGRNGHPSRGSAYLQGSS